MKKSIIAVIGLSTALSAWAATSINSNTSSNSAWGANVGWLNWYADGANGALLGEYVCSGYVYSANVGWINLGSGAPANGVQYQNGSAADFGVNHDGFGNLRGYAYSANIGWINFESTGAPRVDLGTGELSGYIWSANCGWISLSNAVARVKTDTIARGADSDRDGLPDAWERLNFGNLTAVGATDSDGDGPSNLEEYLAGTNPMNPSDNLRITSVARSIVAPNDTTLHWTSQATRFYSVQYRSALDDASPWMDSVANGLGANSATFNTGNANTLEFYRIHAYRPLMP